MAADLKCQTGFSSEVLKEEDSQRERKSSDLHLWKLFSLSIGRELRFYPKMPTLSQVVRLSTNLTVKRIANPEVANILEECEMLAASSHRRLL